MEGNFTGDFFEKKAIYNINSNQTDPDSSFPDLNSGSSADVFSPFDRYPFFSVVIATFNRRHLLPRALESLLSQTEKDWEAIIVDDESHDGTYCQVMPYLRKYSNITYIRQPHTGQASAKNTGAYAATGRYITFLDSDDEYDPRHLANRRSILSKDPSIKLLHGGTKIIGNQFVPDRFNYKEKIDLKDCIIGGSFFVERNLFISFNGFRKIRIGTDSDLFDRIKSAGLSIKKTNLPTYIYHHETEGSITNSLFFSQINTD